MGRYVHYACDGGAEIGAWAGKEGQVTGEGRSGGGGKGNQVLTRSRWLEGQGWGKKK